MNTLSKIIYILYISIPISYYFNNSYANNVAIILIIIFILLLILSIALKNKDFFKFLWEIIILTILIYIILIIAWIIFNINNLAWFLTFYWLIYFIILIVNKVTFIYDFSKLSKYIDSLLIDFSNRSKDKMTPEEKEYAFGKKHDK
jgi:hypothetical protein